ncbi:MAG: hypothetical protein NE327_07245, partial [Lentisphaeraceae bacterium]|nr:hypothetical protein [Lentisphaeraceae bacterium]
VFKHLGIVLKIILIALFSFSGLAKLMDIQAFALSLNAYKILPESVVPFFSYYISLMELGLVIGFLIPQSGKAVAVLTIFVVIVFQAALISLIVRGIEVDCACFGDFGSSPKSALIRNFVILSIVFLLLYGLRQNAKLRNCKSDS